MKQLFLALAATLVAVSGVSADDYIPNSDFCLGMEMQMKQDPSYPNARAKELYSRCPSQTAKKAQAKPIAHATAKGSSTATVSLSTHERNQVVLMCKRLSTSSAFPICQDPRFTAFQSGG